MAGARGLALDVDRAERQLSRALELSPDEDPALLERWGLAVQLQGRLEEARQVLGRALEQYRERGDSVAVGRVLTRLGNVSHRLGDPQCEEMLAEAIELLEAQPPGAELVSAYTYSAGRGLFTRDTPRVLQGSAKALALAAQLGLPEPAFALHIRGLARGGEEGLEDLRRALQLALEQGLGRETAVIHGNLALAIWTCHGPPLAFEACNDTIAFCDRRGIADVGLQNRSSLPQLLAELGRTEEALTEAGLIAEPLEASGDMSWISLRTLQLALLAERGSTEQALDVDELVEAARQTDLAGMIGTALAAAARSQLARGLPERALALLWELEERGSVHGAELGWLVRITLVLGDAALAERLAGCLALDDLGEQHAFASAQAQLAEAAGDHAAAADLYSQAAVSWEQFGNVPERAYALLGQGRCLLALGDPAAEQPLAEARVLFAAMGYEPALAETDSLLVESHTAAS